MKILLFDAVNIKSPYINLGFSQIASVLNRAGHTLEYLSVAWDKDKLGEGDLKRFKFDLILVSCLSSQYFDMLKYLRRFKRVFGAPTLVGGVHPTVAPLETISNEEVDAICIGEGDYAIVEFCDQLEHGTDVTNVRNIWVKRNGEVVKNDVRPLAENLDAFPFPARELFRVGRNTEFGGGRVNIMFGRGCPFKCSYCLNPYLQNLYKGKGEFLRMKSPEYAIRELKEILKGYGVRFFVFNDDTLIFFKEWLREFLPIYQREIGIPFGLTGRVELVDSKICELLRDCGCTQLWLGIESGSRHIRETTLNRHYTDEQVVNAFETARKYSLVTKAYNMIGIPGEGWEEVRETINLNLKVDADIKYVKILQPYAGTSIKTLCEERNLIVGDVREIDRLDGVHKMGVITTGKMNRYEVLASLYLWDIWTAGNILARVRGYIGYWYYRVSGSILSLFFGGDWF